MIFRSPWPDIEVPAGSLCDAVLGSAGQFGDKAAVIEGETGQTLTYLQLIECTEHVAAGLAYVGLRPGEPLALALPSSIDFVVAWYGTLLAGGWVVPINPLYTPAEIAAQLHDSGARFLLTVPELAVMMKGTLDHLFVAGGNWNELFECGVPVPAIRPQPDDLAVLPYSSGTTGKPKGVMLTHSNLLANMTQQAVVWPQHDDVIVNIFPVYHAGGLNGILDAFLRVGATCVLMRRFDLETYLSLCERYSATILVAPPPIVLALTKTPLWDRFRLRTFRQALCGAAPLGTEAHEAFERRTGLVLGQAWAMSEASCAISATPNDAAKRKFGSCGYLLPSCEAQVVDIVSQKPLATGGTGEIWVRGPNIMKGYRNQPVANLETFAHGGWMRTGDIGYFDADGCVFIVDRLKELIKYNAQQVAPAEIEDIIQSHPAVSDAAVVGAPDAVAGEIPTAFVVRRAGATLAADELMAYVAARVAPHKKVRAVEFILEIPKSPSGKILRRVLKERVRGQAAANS